MRDNLDRGDRAEYLLRPGKVVGCDVSEHRRLVVEAVVGATGREDCALGHGPGHDAVDAVALPSVDERAERV